MAELFISTDEQLLAVLFDNQNLTKYPGGLRIPGGGRAVREGDPIAIDTSDDTGLVSKYSQVAATVAQAAVVATLDDAHPFAVGDAVRFDDAAALQEDVTITAINYTTNVITFTPAIIDAAGFAVDDHVSVIANNVDNAIGIALVPVRDRRAAELGIPGADDLTPRGRTTMLGDIALTGRFRLARLRNLVDGTTPQNQNDAALGGTAILAVGVTPGLYVVSTPAVTNLAL